LPVRVRTIGTAETGGVMPGHARIPARMASISGGPISLSHPPTAISLQGELGSHRHADQGDRRAASLPDQPAEDGGQILEEGGIGQGLGRAEGLGVAVAAHLA
jgi:hypothetical protein